MVAASNLTPRSNSNFRARPSGPSGESATMVIAATTHARPAIVNDRTTLRARSSLRVIPIADNRSNSVASRRSWRNAARPTNTRLAAMAIAAKISRRVPLEVDHAPQ